MPNKFVQDLSGPKAGTRTAQDYIGPESGQSDLLKSIGELGGAISDLRSEQILKTAQSEIGLATGAASTYNQAEELYLRQRLAASSSGDKQTVARLDKEFRSIRDGEVSGVLSPMNANIHLQKIAKSYMTRYPHLQKEIKELYQQGYSNIPSTPDYDPIMKAQIELQAAAEKQGKTVQRYLSEIEAKSNADLSENRAKMLAQNGVEYGSALQDMMYRESTVAIDSIINTIEQQMKAGRFDANAGQRLIADAINTLRGGWVEKVSEMEIRSRSTDTPFILSANDKTQMMNAALQGLLQLQEKSAGWDSVERQTVVLNNLKAARSHRLNTLLDKMVPAPLLAMAGENTDLDGMLKARGNVLRAMRLMNQNKGQIPELLKNTADTDPLLMGIMSIPNLFAPDSPMMTDANMKGLWDLAAAYDADGKGAPLPPPAPPTGDKVRDTATAVAHAVTARAGLQTGEKVQMRTGLIGMAVTNPKVLLKEPSTRAILGNPQMKDVATDVLTTLTNRINAIGSRMKLTDLQKFDPQTGERLPENPATYSVASESVPSSVVPSEELREYSDVMNVYRQVAQMAGQSEEEVNAKIMKQHQGYVMAEEAAMASQMAQPGFFQRLLGDSGEGQFNEQVKKDTLTGLKNAVAGPDVNPEVLQLIQDEIATDGANPKIKTLSEGAYEHSETGTIYTVNKDPTGKWSVQAKKNK